MAYKNIVVDTRPNRYFSNIAKSMATLGFLDFCTTFTPQQTIDIGQELIDELRKNKEDRIEYSFRTENALNSSEKQLAEATFRSHDGEFSGKISYIPGDHITAETDDKIVANIEIETDEQGYKDFMKVLKR